MIIIEEIYDWHDDNGERFRFFVSRIGAYCERQKLPSETVGFNASLCDYLTSRAEIDEKTVETMPPSRRDQPVIIAAFPNNTHVLIDGNHRAVRRIRDGFDFIEAFILPLILLKAAGFVLQERP